MSGGLLAVLMCCYNRKVRTIAALQSLFAQPLPPAVRLEVFLVDDASTDGTADAVRQQFPQVQLISGSGQLFWNGAMRLAWQRALAQLPTADAFIWLNDDVVLDADALPRLLLAWQLAAQQGPFAAVVGAMREPGEARLSYGGRRRVGRLRPLSLQPVLPAANSLQRCDFINGNLCLIPAAVVAKIGILSPHFTHSMGDFDYGLRAQQAGFKLWQAPQSFGECASNSGRGGVLDAAVPMARRLQMLQQPNCWPPATEWRYFVSQHGGPLRWAGQLRVLLRMYWPWLFLRLRQRNFAAPALPDNTEPQ